MSNYTRKQSNNLKISKFRALIIIYRAFLLETDVPDIGLDRFYLSFKRERFFKLFDTMVTVIPGNNVQVYPFWQNDARFLAFIKCL